MVAPSGIRLRESCQACASSKIKCSKEKPTCQRCAERGNTCQYLITQKTGRKVRHRSTPSQPAVEPPTSEPQCAPNLDFPLWGSPFETLDPAILDTSSQDCLAMLSHPGDMSFASSPAQHAYEQHALFSSKNVDPNLVGPTACSDTSMDILKDFPGAHNQGLSTQAEGTKTALQLLEQLCSRQDSQFSANLTPSQVELRTTTLIDENKRVAETINSLLECASSEDGYCLVLVCLIVSKVLNGYAQVAHDLNNTEGGGVRSTGGTSSSSSSSSPLSSSSTYSRSTGGGVVVPGASPTAKERDTKAGSLLLDDLYQLRSLLSHLGAKIGACLDRDWILGSDLQPAGLDPTMSTFPFSIAILNQLHEDLRKRLSAISLQVLDRLKQCWV